MSEHKKRTGLYFSRKNKKTIEKKSFFYEKNIINITISIGVSEYKPSSKKAISDTIKESDSAMYEAKRMGRNKVSVFNN